MPIIRRDKDPDVVWVGDCPCDGWMIDLLMWVGSIIGLFSSCQASGPSLIK